MKTLDRDRPFATTYGSAGHAFEQDGSLFDRDGKEIGGKSPPPPPADKKPTGSATETQEEKKAEQSGSPNIASLGLPTKVENALMGAGLATLDQLCMANKDELLALPNIGDAAVKEIVKTLKGFNRKLAG